MRLEDGIIMAGRDMPHISDHECPSASSPRRQPFVFALSTDRVMMHASLEKRQRRTCGERYCLPMGLLSGPSHHMLVSRPRFPSHCVVPGSILRET
jgi:hypothetical protein